MSKLKLNVKRAPVMSKFIEGFPLYFIGDKGVKIFSTFCAICWYSMVITVWTRLVLITVISVSPHNHPILFITIINQYDGGNISGSNLPLLHSATVISALHNGISTSVVSSSTGSESATRNGRFKNNIKNIFIFLFNIFWWILSFDAVKW